MTVKTFFIAILALVLLAGCGSESDTADGWAAPPDTPSITGPEEAVTAEEAKLIALSRAGVVENQAGAVQVTLVADDGVTHYAVTFSCNGYDYSYKIHHVTGAVIEETCTAQGNS